MMSIFPKSMSCLMNLKQEFVMTILLCKEILSLHTKQFETLAIPSEAYIQAYLIFRDLNDIEKTLWPTFSITKDVVNILWKNFGFACSSIEQCSRMDERTYKLGLCKEIQLLTKKLQDWGESSLLTIASFYDYHSLLIEAALSIEIGFNLEIRGDLLTFILCVCEDVFRIKVLNPAVNYEVKGRLLMTSGFTLQVDQKSFYFSLTDFDLNNNPNSILLDVCEYVSNAYKKLNHEDLYSIVCMLYNNFFETPYSAFVDEVDYDRDTGFMFFIGTNAYALHNKHIGVCSYIHSLTDEFMKTKGSFLTRHPLHCTKVHLQHREVESQYFLLGIAKFFNDSCEHHGTLEFELQDTYQEEVKECPLLESFMCCHFPVREELQSVDRVPAIWCYSKDEEISLQGVGYECFFSDEFIGHIREFSYLRSSRKYSLVDAIKRYDLIFNLLGNFEYFFVGMYSSEEESYAYFIGPFRTLLNDLAEEVIDLSGKDMDWFVAEYKDIHIKSRPPTLGGRLKELRKILSVPSCVMWSIEELWAYICCIRDIQKLWEKEIIHLLPVGCAHKYFGNV